MSKTRSILAASLLAAAHASAMAATPRLIA